MSKKSTLSVLIGKSCTYYPDLLYSDALESAFESFAGSSLSEDTDVRSLVSRRPGNSLIDSSLDEQQLRALTSPADAADQYSCLFVNRFLVKKKTSVVPKDGAKLRISKAGMEHLTSILDIPPDFVFALSRYFLPSGRGFTSNISPSVRDWRDFWYILPVRIQVLCTDTQEGHVKSRAGSNQMNPFHYLHLPNQKVDIRGSQIALSFRYTNGGQATSMLAVNFIDGRWPKVVQEPEKRIKGILSSNVHGHIAADPFFIHLIYLTSIMRWWTNALNSIHEQLIAYEIHLQDDQATPDAITPSHEDINRALHAIAAHLHRYSSELTSIEDTTNAIVKTHRLVYSVAESNMSDAAFQRVEDGFNQAASHLKAAKAFELELEKKIENILALLFSRIQLSNDRIMVANGTAMQGIMKATQEEAQASRDLALKTHKLSESMKKDSLSMKTIAVLTMFFLPGTSFAALLSMPFFNDNAWLAGASRFWVWIVLTVPCTALAFAFYLFRKSRNAARDKEIELC